jgi:hypothetical protein
MNMANIQLIINSLKTIAAQPYHGTVSSRKTLHHVAFDRLQGSAKQVAAILTQNPNPNRDQRENLMNQISAMKKDVNSYCPSTAGTEPILSAFNKASTEWELYVKHG